MALELEAPSVIEQPEVRLFAEPPEAVEAAELLESVDEAAREFSTEPQHKSKAVVIRLTREVSDATSAFSGHAGETYDGYVDADGDTWIPLLSGDICLEAEEFEIVQPLAETTEATPDETEATPDDTPTSPAPKPQPSAYEIRRRKYLREKDILQEQISALMIEQAKLREQIKKCKKEAEVYCEQLSELIESWEHQAQLENEPPTAAGPMAATSPSIDAGGFGAVPPDRPASQADAQAEPAGAPDSPAPTHASQAAEQAAEQAHYQRALEAASLDQLGLPSKLVERLQEAGATTVWRLEQLRAEIAQGREKWPKGIGEAKVTQIEDAIISWMGRNSETWQKSHRDAIAEEVAAETVTAEESPAAAGAPAVSTDIDDL